MNSRRSWLAPSLLLVLALLAFWPLVLHPTETLYSDTNDLLAEHLPAKLFLVRSLRETGELPLWNPEQYTGSPFVHDIQVGLFYPPNLPLYFLSEPAVGPFVSWLVFAHVVLAGWLMYAYARHAGLGELGAFTAACGYMLAPRWMMQLFLAGHTVTAGICWVPLVLLCVEKAIQGRGWRWAVLGGVAYALFILGTHPQWTFYGSLLIGLWPLRLLTRLTTSREGEWPESLAEDSGEPSSRRGPITSPSPPEAGGEGRGEEGLRSRGAKPASSPGEPEPPSPPTPLPPKRGERGEERQAAEVPRPSSSVILIRWLVAEAVVVLVGLCLSAVQLLPTIEAAGETSRSRGMAQSWGLTGAMAAATSLIGPFPDKVAEPIHWEARGGIGFTWAVLALAAPWIAGPRARFPAWIALGMLAYALGGSILIDRLPGFSSFRMPTRMFLTLAFPITFLAGMSVQSLTTSWPVRPLAKGTGLALALAAVPGLLALAADTFTPLAETIAGWRVYWVVVPVIWGAFLWLGGRWPGQVRVLVCAGILILDLSILSVPYAGTRPADEIYPRSPLIDFIHEQSVRPSGGSDRAPVRMYDPDQDGGGCFLGAGSPSASAHGIQSIRGYNPLDVARYRQFLAFIADVGEPQRAFSDFAHPVTGAFEVKNRPLFDLLGVEWIVTQPGDPLIDPANPPAPTATDPAPRSYNFLGKGVQTLPPLVAFANRHARPRAFVATAAVPEAPERYVLDQLNSLDPGGTATLADWDPTADPVPQSGGLPGAAAVRSYKPNEVVIELDAQTAGVLVLTDPWYPGWVCRIDGRETKIWKADYAFRGVMVPDGSRQVVFRFEPQSYRRGKWVSVITVVLVFLFGIGLIGRAAMRPRFVISQPIGARPNVA